MKARRTFVMADIHGMHRALVQCLEGVNFDKERDTLIQLGDVADRGPEVYECIEELLTIKNRICIKGNHDEWLQNWMEKGVHPGMHQGGRESIESYLRNCKRVEGVDYMNDTGLDIPETHKKFLREQLPYYIDKDLNIFIHGGFNRHKLLADNEPGIFWWDRDLWHCALSYESMQRGLEYKDPSTGNRATLKIKEPCKEIFIGHTPTVMWGKGVPMKAANVINLDTGAGMYGKLTIMNLETREFFQSSLVTTLYP